MGGPWATFVSDSIQQGLGQPYYRPMTGAKSGAYAAFSFFGLIGVLTVASSQGGPGDFVVLVGLVSGLAIAAIFG
jgi:hypothetical protein